MAWSFGLNPRSQNSGGTSRGFKFPREHERVSSQGVSCHLGHVLDISGGGMRIRTERAPGISKGDQCSFGVRSSRHQVSVRGQIVWTRRAGWKCYEIGVRWLDASPVHVQLLLQLARYGFVNIEETKGDPVPPAGGTNGAKASGGFSAGSSTASGAAGPAHQNDAIPETFVEDLYAVLAVPRTSKPEEIQVAFRALARQLHPDVNKDTHAQERFTRVNKAYSVLRDADTRRRYDILLAGGSIKPGM